MCIRDRHYVEIGNEDWFDKSGSYDGRFAQYFKAIKQRYPGKTSARCQRCSAFAAGWVPQNKANLLSLIQNVEHEAICA